MELMGVLSAQHEVDPVEVSQDGPHGTVQRFPDDPRARNYISCISTILVTAFRLELEAMKYGNVH